MEATLVTYKLSLVFVTNAIVASTTTFANNATKVELLLQVAISVTNLITLSASSKANEREIPMMTMKTGVSTK